MLSNLRHDGLGIVPLKGLKDHSMSPAHRQEPRLAIIGQGVKEQGHVTIQVVVVPKQRLIGRDAHDGIVKGQIQMHHVEYAIRPGRLVHVPDHLTHVLNLSPSMPTARRHRARFEKGSNRDQIAELFARWRCHKEATVRHAHQQSFVLEESNGLPDGSPAHGKFGRNLVFIHPAAKGPGTCEDAVPQFAMHLFHQRTDDVFLPPLSGDCRHSAVANRLPSKADKGIPADRRTPDGRRCEMVEGTPDSRALVPDAILDAGTGRLRSGLAIWIEGPTIHSIVDVAELPPTVSRLDLPGCTALPGLVDCHVHLDLAGSGGTFEALGEDDETLAIAASSHARDALRAGITTVRDCGSRGRTVRAVHRAVELGLVPDGADVLWAGAPMTITGGHTWPMGGEADGPEGCRQAVRERVRNGSTFIKVIHSGGGTPNTRPWFPAFRPEELQAIADEAHRLGRKVTAHCLCAEAMREAVQAGIDQIEHGYFYTSADGQTFDEKTADLLASRGVPVTPTLSVAYLEAKARAGDGNDRWKYMADVGFANAQGLLRTGVELVAGTDAGWRHVGFDSLITEIELLAEVGLGALGAIRAATAGAARALDLEGKIGSLEAGSKADILIVRGDPTRDLSLLRRPEWVMKSGQVIRLHREGSTLPVHHG